MNVKSIVTGTAGHIDHGKTSLVKALTGVDCDRLADEKKRGITIDIGFAALSLPGGSVTGIVDVPGHQRFIHNMLAGAGGIDIALFVISADDSIMPQTTEHMDILETLGIERGVVAVTKADLVDDGALARVMDEVSRFVSSSCLAGARIIPCSSVTGMGIAEVKSALETLCEQTATVKRADAFFRLPVDRVFNIKGHGLVVTGTVFSGNVQPGDRLTLSPGGAQVRVRRAQSYWETVENAVAGSRAAVNISGVNRHEVHRGMVLCHPMINRSWNHMTAEIKLSRTATAKIMHGKSYLLHIHTAQTQCKVHLADGQSLSAGKRGIARIYFQKPIQIMNGDRFVLRSSSARHTLGGGIVLEPGGAPVSRRLLVAGMGKWTALKKRETGLTAIIHERPWGLPVKKLYQIFNAPEGGIDRFLKENRGRLSTFELKGEPHVYEIDEGSKIKSRIVNTVAWFHKKNPALQGMDEGALAKSAMPMIPPDIAGYWIRRVSADGKIEYEGSSLKIPRRAVSFSGEDEKQRSAVLKIYEKSGLKNPPKTDKVYRVLGMTRGEASRMIRILTLTGDLAALAPDYTVHHSALNNAERILQKELEGKGYVETARYRDLLGVGRKSAIAILEYFDKAGITKRVENRRYPASTSREFASENHGH